jgi:hypothetical protein
VSKAAIPVLREQGGGLIMQFSSMGGRVGGSPGIASYQAAKFAIDGLSRVLQTETAPFGIKVIVIEPSGFRTDWAGSSMTVRAVPEEYAEILTWRGEGSGVAAGDPDRAPEIVVKVAKRRDIPRNLPLGVNASEGSIRLDQERLAEDRKRSAVSRSADYAERSSLSSGSAAGYVFAYEPKAMSSTMSVRLGDQSRSSRVLSEDRRLFSDRLIPDAALGGGVNEPPMFPTVSASMPSICNSERLSVCSSVPIIRLMARARSRWVTSAATPCRIAPCGASSAARQNNSARSSTCT